MPLFDHMVASKGLIERSAAGRPPGESRPLPLQPSPKGWPSPVVPTHQATRVAETCFRSDSKARSRQAARRSPTIEPAFCRLHSPPADLAAPIPGITETKKGIAKRVPPRSDSSQRPIQPRHTTAAIGPTASCATRSPLLQPMRGIGRPFRYIRASAFSNAVWAKRVTPENTVVITTSCPAKSPSAPIF